MLYEVITEVIETIDYDTPKEEGVGLAETIKIDEDGKATDQKEEDDALHPKAVTPRTPVSEDSGTLF